jgi:hypothetical protein
MPGGGMHLNQCKKLLLHAKIEYVVMHKRVWRREIRHEFGLEKLEFSLHSHFAYHWEKENYTSASLERLCFCIRYFCMNEAGKSTSLGQGNKGAS